MLLTTFEHPVRPTWRGWVFDVALAAIMIPLSLPAQVHQERPITPGAVVLMILTVAPLAVRRVRPVAVLVWVALGSLAALLPDPPLAPTLAMVVALYTVAAQCPRWFAVSAAAVLNVAGISLAVGTQDADWWLGSIFVTGLTLSALALGLYRQTRRQYLAELEERARRLERERDQQGELAAAAERARIAREIHDIVAHHLTVMIALTDGLAAAREPGAERTREVLRAVSGTGRQALTDTRRLLGVLRESDDTHPDGGPAGSREPVPELADLDALVDRVRSAGLPVTLEVHGSAPVIAGGVQLAAYRIVQEALTNTLKHAGGGTPTVVRIRYSGDELRLEVEDDGPPTGAHPDQPATGSGRGLTGMRERVQAYDGEFRSGRRPGGGWHVAARLPLAAAGHLDGEAAR